MPPAAIVLNMFYTGLGIARSLGSRGVRVIGLTPPPGIYGNYTRYATIRECPDSAEDPEMLVKYLVELARDLGHRAVIFPTRDHDIVFLDQHREVLSKYFSLVVASHEVVTACLDKWETYLWACKAGLASPRCFIVQGESDLDRALDEIGPACIMKPTASYHWRKHGNWAIVGARKAIAIHSQEELRAEYAQISHADSRVLLQEMVAGDDDQLFVAACYLDKSSKLVASFTVRKLVQSPPGVGTGCIVQAVDRADVVAPAVRVLQAMKFTGIAEVEFKYDSASGELKLIEINARPWDQHSLGAASGVDLIHLAYCEHAGLPLPAVSHPVPIHKWIAEDVFLTTALRLLWRRDAQGLRRLFLAARGKRIYGIWSRQDKRPSLLYMFQFLSGLTRATVRYFAVAVTSRVFRWSRPKTGATDERRLQNIKSNG